MFSSKTLLPALALATLSAACASKNDGSSLAADTSGADDVVTTESNMESFGSSFVGTDGMSVASPSSFGASGSELHVQGITTVGNPGFFFQPAGCVQATVDSVRQTATYVFASCTGPLGLTELTGTVTVTWQLSSGALTLDFSASGFKINLATISNWQATAVVTASGSARHMTWSGQLSGTTGSGRTFSRTNQKVLDWVEDVACLSVSGQSTGDISGTPLQITVGSYKRCADACPEAGSEITAKNLDNGDTIGIDYLGGPTADLTLDGKTEKIGLVCGL